MRWVVLLRAVNVGGTGKLAMAELRAALPDIGASEVASYIQSGNLLLDHPEADPRGIEARVGDLIAERFGFRPEVVALDIATLDAALAEAPFPPGLDPKFAHLVFFTRQPNPETAGVLAPFCGNGESVHLGRACLYVGYPNGSGRSNLTGRIEKALGCPATARNLNSVRKIRALA